VLRESADLRCESLTNIPLNAKPNGSHQVLGGLKSHLSRWDE